MAESQEKHIAFGYNDAQSPYYLNNSDHPGYIISLVILNRDNYGRINALKSKNKLRFVDGTLAKPTSTAPEINSCPGVRLNGHNLVIQRHRQRSTQFCCICKHSQRDLD